MPDPATSTKALLVALALCAGSAAAPAASFGQPVDSFNQIDLGVETIEGIISMQAESGWVWRTDSQTPQRSTSRIILDRDVQVVIGGSRLNARRADIWLSPTGDGTYQVFAVFEKLTSADGSFSGNQVPVRAVVRVQESIILRLGARIDEQPSPQTRKDLVEFMERSQAVYDRRVLQIEDPQQAAAPALRWAPKELPSANQPVADSSRVLPMPTVERGVSRVKKVLASSRGEDIIAQLQAEHDARIAERNRARAAADPISDPDTSDTTKRDTKPPVRPPEPIFRATGIFSIAIDGKVVVQGQQEAPQTPRPATITADGGVTMQYQDPATRQTMDLEAERAVIFLKGDSQSSTPSSQINASDIEGIYLEGGVFAGNADWSVRSPKIYIDLVNDKMLMLDAVFWTVDQRTSMPLYLRADSVRQTSLGEFEAKKARISNSAFFEPDLSVGVSTLKVSVREEEYRRGGLLGLVGSVSQGFGTETDQPTVEPGTDLVRRVYIDGKNITLRLGSVPVFWLPRVKGDSDAFPLKEVRIGDSNRSGLALRTRWDAYSLFGIDPIPNTKASLQIDYYGERGTALGLSGNWNTNNHRGSLYSYLLPNDNGTDITSAGREIARDGQTRGIISASDIWNLDNPWTIITKGTYISDEAYVPAFEEQLGRETPDFDSMLRIERTGERNQFALELSGSPNDFFAAEHLLQSPGYAVDKIPEASFVSVSNDLFPETLPGVFDYQYEASIGAMRLRFSEVTAAEYGFDTASLATSVFGTAPGVSLADTQRALGLDEDTVGRFDTRHEVSARFDAGPLQITPFVVGRVTAYDTSFDTFTPTQTDDIRYWGAAGMTVATTLTKVNDNANSDFFDVHRLRHTVEPSVTLWHADSAFAVGDTPIFDDDVEGLLRGSMIRAAVDQTWTTKRGGPGRWRDADILKLNTEYVWSSDRAGTSVIPDYFAPRPELSNPGTFIGSDIIFSPTDVLAFSGSIIFDLDLDKTARTSAGAIVEHRPGFVSSIEYRDIRAIDATFLTGATSYTLTDKYAISTSANYNFDRGDFQNFFARIERQFQIGTLGLSVSFDNIRSETSIGVVFRPFGTSGTSFGPGGDFLGQ